MPLSTSSIDVLAEDIFNKIRAYDPEMDLEQVREAYEFAKMAHHGQLRKSGEPYIIHPLRTVKILTNLRVDKETLIAGLLHDVPEDTTVSIDEINKRFGEKIAYLVDGITKLAKVHYRERMEQRQIESLKKLFIHSAEDLRVILIKLADRLDNMRSLRFIAHEKKRMRIARETLEIYVPMANLLGIGEIRAELENLCFEYLNPADYENLKREVEENMEERNFILEEMIRIVERELNKLHIEAEIVGRPKTLYSIYRKLQIKQTLHNIDDLIAIRIIVPTRNDCYTLLGLIHRLFKPKTGGIKDYIAVPKPNGYQSLHTTVFGLNSSIIEFQIRTRYMHLEAEYGVAAHYFYKYSDENELTNIMRQRSSWMQRVLEIQKDNQDPHHFIENLKLDLFQDRIFVFSPKGDVIDLPRGACALDFAYAIHPDIGNHALKAEINGIIFPVTATLGTGDTMRVITQKDIRPEREWLGYVKTALASNKIKEHLKKEPIEVKRMIGKKFLQKEFDRIGKNFLDELTPKRLRVIAQKTPYSTLDDVLIAVGEGNINPQNILELLYDEKEYGLSHTVYFIKKRTVLKKGFLSRIGLAVWGDNSKDQFREIIRTLNGLNIPIVKFLIKKSWLWKEDRCKFSVMVSNYNELAQIFESLEKLEGVRKIRRRFLGRKISFSILSGCTLVLWLMHPFLVRYTFTRLHPATLISSIILYAGLLLLVSLVFLLKRMAQRSFPELAETTYYWLFLYGLNTLAFFTIFGEMFKFNLPFNWLFGVIAVIAVYAILTVSYINYKKQQFK